MLGITLAVAVKVAVVLPAATVTEPDCTSSGLPLDKLTVVPTTGALVSVTVHVLTAPELKVVGLQVSEESAATGAAILRVVDCETPFNVAVSVAD